MNKHYFYKLVLILLSGLFIQSLTNNSYSQSPEFFNYQAVVRDASGAVIANQQVSFRISILQGSTSGTDVFTETHTYTTNSFGLANLVIGNGSLVSGSISLISWGEYSFYLKVEFDPNGGAAYQTMATTQLVSVPYALHAETVKNDMVNDADHDPVNEIQTMSLISNQLSLSKAGGSVTLPSASPWQKNNAGGIYYYSGRVGIGTVYPGVELAFGDSGADIMFQEGDGSRISWMESFVQKASIGLDKNDFRIINSISGGELSIISNGRLNLKPFTGQTMTCYIGGNTGIGKYYPACELHIKQTGTGYNNGLRLERSDNSDWWSIQTNYNSDLVFDFNGTDTRAWLDQTSAGFHNISDRRLKKDIESIENVLGKVMMLRPVTYRFSRTRMLINYLMA